VRLPKLFRLNSEEEVEIFRRGDDIVLREKDGSMVRAFDPLADLQPPEKTRGGFSAISQAQSRGSSAFCHLELGRVGSLFFIPVV
jgi:virulence-associated protein VagC